ncbi:UDP-glucuronate:xylan alpha-glucuronosyltransferase 3-like [Dorcoceras hygrometricum]|uniref:UDP-glucuronate:xylan alpha-glucuronosyltransferase 3-like n=1 Tax=Dorcoceras hygrometricum TaxID=472368 RepID=A0A2Z7B4A5_9LAMI|nr:UDP-glucuronate:xylan alpha-glucuronosyltransferase 3-like [Dorcoceras hygrometricum]
MLALLNSWVSQVIHRVFSQLPCWRLGAWLRPVSRGNRHFTVGGGRLRQSGSRTSKNPLPMLNTLSSVSVRESRIQYLCDPQLRRSATPLRMLPLEICATIAPEISSSGRPHLGLLRAASAWLRPVSRGNRHFTVGDGRLRQSGPQSEGRLLCQPALEGLTRSSRTDSTRKFGGNKFRRGAAAAWRPAAAATFVRGGRRP